MSRLYHDLKNEAFPISLGCLFKPVYDLFKLSICGLHKLRTGSQHNTDIIQSPFNQILNHKKPLNKAVKLIHSQCKIPFSFTSPDQYQTDFKEPHNACESFESYSLDFSQLRRNTFLTIRKADF